MARKRELTIKSGPYDPEVRAAQEAMQRPSLRTRTGHAPFKRGFERGRDEGLEAAAQIVEGCAPPWVEDGALLTNEEAKELAGIIRDQKSDVSKSIETEKP